MVKIEDALIDLGFAEAVPVQGRASIADLFRRGQRCGLYVLHCSAGEHYAGKAVDVTRRYIQHRKIHTDIEKIAFKSMAEERLAEEEPRVIQTLETLGFLLRNVQFTNFPLHSPDLDTVIPPEEQAQWLQDVRYRNMSGNRAVGPVQRRKYARRYQRFRGLPHAAEVAHVLRKYIQVGIPSPFSTEMSFWCCTCLPPYRTPGVVVYSRICVHTQEVFTAGTAEDVPFFSWHLAQSPIKEVIDRLRKQYSLTCFDHQYKAGGTDQLNVEIRGSVGDALALLDEPKIVLAIRRFNLALLRKGPSINSLYHCMDLADLLLQASP
jgi:hypothetical protein